MAVLIGAVPPVMVKSAANPGGLPKEIFDGLQAQLAANRTQFYRDLASGPFYGYNRPGAKPSQGAIQSFRAQGMEGGHKNTYDSIAAFSATDFTEDLKRFDVPTLVIHGADCRVRNRRGAAPPAACSVPPPRPSHAAAGTASPLRATSTPPAAKWWTTRRSKRR